MGERADDAVTSRKFESLQKLAGKNFLRFAVSVQHVSTEVQLKLIAQLPEFRKLATDAFESLDKAAGSASDSNDASEAYVHEGYQQWRQALIGLLNDPNLSLDDKLRITAEIGKVSEAQSRKDSESKDFKMALFRQRAVSTVAVVGLVVLAVAGGGLALSQGDKEDGA